MEALSYTLLSLAHNTPTKLLLQEGARAVAILLVDEVARSMSLEVMCYIEKQLELVFNNMGDLQGSLEARVESAKKAA